MGPTSAPTLTKAERTRESIVDAALTLFVDQGFDATTMRQIATAAEVSVGNAYYYFASKEALVLAIYERFAATTTEPVLAAASSRTLLADRIVAGIEAWFTVMRPYRTFASAMFRNVADPSSPMSPIGPGSAAVRDASFAVWRVVLEGASDVRLDAKRVDPVSKLLWGFTMAMVVAWVQDPTSDSRRVKKLLRRLAPMVSQLVSMSSVPAFSPWFDQGLDLLDEISSLRTPVR